jgi:hypothetical protein
MHRDPNSAARLVLMLALAGGATLAGCGGEEPPPGLTIDFSRQELLRDAALVQIYFYEGSMSCEALRAQNPRLPSVLGPYAAMLDDAGRERGITFTLKEVPAGDYVVFVDALDASGTIVGTGCAPGQRVFDRQISRIRVTIG